MQVSHLPHTRRFAEVFLTGAPIARPAQRDSVVDSATFDRPCGTDLRTLASALAVWYTRNMSSSTLTSTTSSSILTPKRAGIAAVVLLAVLAVLVLLSPAEAQLGNLIKIIYLHGALARVGIYAILLAGVLGLVYLIRPRAALLRWSNGVQVAGLIAFVTHFALSVIPTHETWGMWIAFDEPRTQMSLQIIGVGIIVVLVRRLVNDDRLSGLANALLGIAVLLLNVRTGVLRHPLNAIGDSTSTAIQGFYFGIVLACAALVALLAWYLTYRAASSPTSSS